MATFMFVRHKVHEYRDWKVEFDLHQPKRIAAGLTETHVLRVLQDGNDVVICMEVADLDLAMAFAESGELRLTLEKAGVIGEPEILFLKG